MEIECQVQGDPLISEGVPDMEPGMIPDEQVLDPPDADDAQGEVEEATVGTDAPVSPSDNVAAAEEATSDKVDEESSEKDTDQVTALPALPAILEQEIGHLSGAHSCSNNHVQGTFYVGSEGFSTLFLLHSSLCPQVGQSITSTALQNGTHCHPAQ